ncbi:MAG: AAA family ATPase [Solirubrobacterales bacterium]
MQLLERERELEAIASAVAALAPGGDGGTVLIEGAAGVGKTSLLRELEAQAAGAGHRVLRARGSELERDFGYGIVRQLFGPALRASAAERERLLGGPAGLAASVFGFGPAKEIESRPAESTLYGLFWLTANLAGEGTLVLAIDDAHWSDAGSLRFLRYLAQRLAGMPVLLALAARPHEPGVQTEILAEMATALELPRLAPDLLSRGATAAKVRAGLGERSSTAIEAAAHEATGGNPFLVEELLAELRQDDSGEAAPASDRIAAISPERIAASVEERARRLGPLGPEVCRAAAVLGGAASPAVLGALVESDAATAARMVDSLAAAAILSPRGDRFLHPLLRAAVYEGIPAATRTVLHGRAAAVLADRGASAEEVAAHLLRAEPGATPDALQTLERAADAAAKRGATDAATTLLRRALEERTEDQRRAELLHELAVNEIALRDPAAITHLQEAAAMSADPEQALRSTLHLIEVLAIAGLWSEAAAAIAAAGERFGGSDLSGALDIEALRAAAQGYDPAAAAEFEADLPRLLALALGSESEEAELLRAVLSGLASLRGLPRETVLALARADRERWTMMANGRETSQISNAALSLILVDHLEPGDRIAADLLADGRRRGSLMATITGFAIGAAVDNRKGRLAAAEANLSTALELLQANRLSLMAMTTTMHFCIDTIVERRAMEPIAELLEGLDVPPPFGATASGAMVREARATARLARGDRAGAIADLREAGTIFEPIAASPWFSRWRSRLALALGDAEPGEALALARAEHAAAQALGSPRCEAVALRAIGVLEGGEEGIARLRDSVALLRPGPARFELACSLAELGAALRRANLRSEAREVLREALDRGQRCGAERLEARVQAELRIAGAKPRRRAVSGAAALTPAERRVAEAANAGATNREIAQDLFVSLRTVEMHLTNAYRKLGIASRAELAAALAPA